MSNHTANQEKNKKEPSDHFFNKEMWRKISLLSIGFVLTAVIGARLSFEFQKKALIINSRLSLMESERKVAKALFDEVTTAMDSRVYYSQVVNDSYSFDPTKKVSDDKWGDYVRQLKDWNININKREKMVRLYFGKRLGTSLETVHDLFVALNSQINQVRLGNNPAAYNRAKADIDEINNRIDDMSEEMINRMQVDNVGKIPDLKKSF